MHPGMCSKCVKTLKPVSSNCFNQFINWLAGTMPEYHDMKVSTQEEGRAITRGASDDGIKAILKLCVTRKYFGNFGLLCD